MHTIRRYDSPLDRLSEALGAFLRRRAVEAGGIVLVAGSIAAALALASWSVNDPSWNNATSAPARNLLGAPGAIGADLLIQIFGLGSVAFLLGPAAWGLRLLRQKKLERPIMRFLLWGGGIMAAAATASALPPTTRWPLLTGLGGVVGDGVLGLRHVVGLSGATGAALAGLGFAALAILLLTAACSAGRRPPETAAAEPMPRGRRGEDREEASSDEEPSWAIISLGALAHAAMSLKSALRRKVEAGLEAHRGEDGHLARTASALERRAPTAAGMRREPSFGDAPVPARPAPARPQPVVAERRAPAAPPDVFDEEEDEDAPPVAAARGGRKLVIEPERSRDEVEPEFDDLGEDEEEEPACEPPPRAAAKPPAAPARPAPSRVSAPAAPVRQAVRQPEPEGDYEIPSLGLLSEAKKQVATVSKDALEQNATLLESTLEDFGVRGEIINVRPGPVVTLYELEPAPGTKSSRVIGLADDIARSMSAVSARVAVVPGRNAIGIELPNQKRETVYLRELLSSADFVETKQKLALCLGKNIGGEPIIADLARMPHLLVAGTTGSGKSVAINTMILSLLYKHTPEQCRLIMVDPKMLELSVYDGIPHLLSPVVTDPKKAVIALKWAVREMEERYKKMSKLGVRNIDGFNARVAEASARHEVITRTVQTGFDNETGEAIYEDEIMDLEPLPYIVVIVDEMADLMMVAGKDIEGAIQRLAQMARAAGIHLIMATQRPSVDVITGTIKANFPTRISFQVTSKIDSRTILGEMGAEQLLGQGDMLYMAGGGRITRVHGPFVSDNEVEKVVAHLKAQGRPQYLDAVTTGDEDGPAGGGDEAAIFDKGSFGEEGGDLYDQAIQVVLRDKKASTSYIQRRLGIGYNRAASIMERMENEGIVGPANHAGKREILMENVGAGD
ncbi:FtsK/SpoIIIE family DNA translocase [Enterovirga aerilata]|uniref:DNA translocase FtsK n=1 Tax=Enterovirga aerilata TaxID=2730920 RepID=A0A849I165_9HYPH|nr:DNA translocase FtsK 4TM domain-containing protein [Enterovirga sp. DB1703]NNM71121.1 cell division protein FtsK [Enterovirga sp. DB1703]